MAVSKTLEGFLQAQEVDYRTVRHGHTESATRTAQAAHVPGDHLAKGVVLVVDDGSYRLAILPATHRLHLGRLHRLLGEHVGLATEAEVARLFGDCERGAVPALGAAFGLESLVDETLLEQDTVYLEGGDHERLVQLGGSDFLSLLGNPLHGEFSEHI